MAARSSYLADLPRIEKPIFKRTSGRKSSLPLPDLMVQYSKDAPEQLRIRSASITIATLGDWTSSGSQQDTDVHVGSPNANAQKELNSNAFDDDKPQQANGCLATEDNQVKMNCFAANGLPKASEGAKNAKEKRKMSDNDQGKPMAADCCHNDEKCIFANETGTEFSDLGEDAERKGSVTSQMSDTDYDVTNESKWRGMTKNHYVDKASKKRCTGCNKQFTLKRRAFHCRRCGGVFCLKCVKYRRKLNKIANPDPEGTPRKVCRSCFEEDILVFGSHRNLTDDFKKERQLARYSRVINQRVNSLTTSFWRDELDIRQECKRLLNGFQSKMKRSESRNALQEFRGAIKTPEWQKSPYWNLERQAEQCRVCKDTKIIRKSSGNCRVCGLALCKKCSWKDLLLYYPNNLEDLLAKLVIVNAPGSPEKEPSICLYLYICGDCKDYISIKQTLDILWYRDVMVTGPIDLLGDMDATFTPLCKHISTELSSLQEWVQTLGECKDQFSASEKKKHTGEIAKIQLRFDEYEKQFAQVKKLLHDAQTKTQKMLLHNYVKGKYEFLMEHKHTFRRLKNKPLG